MRALRSLSPGNASRAWDVNDVRLWIIVWPLMVRNPSYPRLPMSYAFHEYDGPIAFLADPEGSQHHSPTARPLFPACEESRGARETNSERTRLPGGVSAAAWIRTEYSTARTLC